jgi:hypothetical protein
MVILLSSERATIVASQHGAAARASARPIGATMATIATASRGSTSLPNQPQVLTDGSRVRLDFLGPGDREDLLNGFEGLSKRSRYLRFFSPMPSLPPFIVDGLLSTDGSDHVAIGARQLSAGGEVRPAVVGVARYSRADHQATVAWGGSGQAPAAPPVRGGPRPGHQPLPRAYAA